MIFTLLFLAPKFSMKPVEASTLQPITISQSTNLKIQNEPEVLVNRSSLVSPVRAGFEGVEVHLEVPRVYLTGLKAGYSFSTESANLSINVKGAKDILLVVKAVGLEGEIKEAFEKLYVQITTEQGNKLINLLAGYEEATRFSEGETDFKMKLLGKVSYGLIPWIGGNCSFGLEYTVLAPDGSLRASPNLFVLKGFVNETKLFDSLGALVDVYVTNPVHKVGDSVEIKLDLTTRSSIYVFTNGKVLKKVNSFWFFKIDEEFQNYFSLKEVERGTHTFEREAVEEGYYFIRVETMYGSSDHVEFYVKP